MTKNIIIVVLAIVGIVFAYMLFVQFPEKAEAECAEKVEAYVEEAVTECMTQAEQCATTLEYLMSVPECAEMLN